MVLINPKRKKNTGSALAGWLVYGLLLIPAAVQAAPLSLWKIEHDQAVVYLVGSVHVLKADDYPLPAAFQMAFDAQALDGDARALLRYQWLSFYSFHLTA